MTPVELEERDEVTQIGFFKDHQENAEGPVLDLKLRSSIRKPTDKPARRLQKDLRQAGWLFHGFERRCGNLYVQYEGKIP